MVLMLIFHVTNKQIKKMFSIEQKKNFLHVNFVIFQLQVVHVEDVIVLIIVHYLVLNNHNEFDSHVVEYQHLQVSKMTTKQSQIKIYHFYLKDQLCKHLNGTVFFYSCLMNSFILRSNLNHLF